MNNTATKILVVDDEAAITEMMKDFLSAYSYEVFVASTGQKADELLAQNNFNLCLLDMKLPDINGIDLLKKIRQEANATKVIVITGSAADYEDELEDLGADMIMRKPIVLKELVEHIKNFVTES